MTTPNPDKEEKVSSDEEDKTANEDRGEENNEIDTVDINASLASQASNETIQDTNENQSSDIYNDDDKPTKRPRLFPTWGENTKSPVKSTWGDTPKPSTGRHSPTNLPHRFTECQFCETQLVTRVKMNGPLTCFKCTRWL